MRKLRLLSVLVLLALLLSAGQRAVMGQGLLSQGGILGTDEGVEPAGEEALIRDAKMYASRFGVDLDEAIRRLKLQSEIGDLNAELAAKERDTFAGLWIQHQPEYRVIVQFTRNGRITIQPYIGNGPLADTIEVRTASVTLAELEAARDRAGRVVSELGIRDFSAINVIENRAELYVLDPEQFNIALRKANLQLPANVEVIKVNELPREVDAIFGGLALTTCTSGFSVKKLRRNQRHHNGGTL